MSDSDLENVLDTDDPPTEDPKTPAAEDPPKDGEEAGAEGASEDGGEDPDKASEPMMPVAAHVAERKEWQGRVEFAETVARQNATPAGETPKADPPDFLLEPDKLAGYVQEQVRAGMQSLSRTYADRAHGAGVVQSAHDELVAHGTPAEQQALFVSADPWGGVVDWSKNRKVMAEIGEDPTAFIARIKKEALAEAAVAQAKGGVTPAASLAGSPNLGALKDDGSPEPGMLAKVLDD